MAQILIRGLDAETAKRLKARASRNGRSLQSEAKRILENATGYTIEEALQHARRWQRKWTGRRLSDSAKLIREDRKR